VGLNALAWLYVFGLIGPIGAVRRSAPAAITANAPDAAAFRVAAPVRAVVTTGADSTFGVLVGEFLSETRARQVASLLSLVTRKSARVDTLGEKSNTRYQVWLGPFRSREEAERAARWMVNPLSFRPLFLGQP
jgi:hypothetical protein